MSAPSTLCHRQAIPSMSSYSARPACHSFTKKPAASHSRNLLWIALALPKRSDGNAFHWHPVRSTYTIASNTNRASLGLRPPPGLRIRFLPASARGRSGISGSTRCQNSSDTFHDSSVCLANVFSHRAAMPRWESSVSCYLRISSKPPGWGSYSRSALRGCPRRDTPTWACGPWLRAHPPRSSCR